MKLHKYINQGGMGLLRIKNSFYLRRSPGINIVVEVLADGAGEATRFAINESGAVLWETLKNGADKDDLLSAIQSEYSVESGEAMRDIEEFLDMLRAKNVLEE